jgi:hypothetical protein
MSLAASGLEPSTVSLASATGSPLSGRLRESDADISARSNAERGDAQPLVNHTISHTCCAASAAALAKARGVRGRSRFCQRI